MRFWLPSLFLPMEKREQQLWFFLYSNLGWSHGSFFIWGHPLFDGVPSEFKENIKVSMKQKKSDRNTQPNRVGFL